MAHQARENERLEPHCVPFPMTLLFFLGTGVSGLLLQSPCTGGWWWQCQQRVTLQCALHARTDEALQLVVQHMLLPLLLPPCSCFPVWLSFHEWRVPKGQQICRQISHHVQQSRCGSGAGGQVEAALLGATQHTVLRW